MSDLINQPPLQPCQRTGVMAAFQSILEFERYTSSVDVIINERGLFDMQFLYFIFFGQIQFYNIIYSHAMATLYSIRKFQSFCFLLPSHLFFSHLPSAFSNFHSFELFFVWISSALFLEHSYAHLHYIKAKLVTCMYGDFQNAQAFFGLCFPCFLGL